MEIPENPVVLKVCDRQCNQCLYTKNKIVSDSRRDGILQELAESKDYFVCHKATEEDDKIMCRGYYEANKLTSILILLGQSLGLIEFVTVPKNRTDK